MKDRDQRYASVEAFARDLTRWYYSNVTDLEAESLKRFMHEVFIDDIRTLEQLAEEEKGLVPGRLARAGACPCAKPAQEALPTNERTVAMPVDSQAPTMMEGSVSRGGAAGPAARGVVVAEPGQAGQLERTP